MRTIKWKTRWIINYPIKYEAPCDFCSNLLNLYNNMINKLFSTKILYRFALQKSGKEMVAELPKIDYPVRPQMPDEETFPKEQAYDLMYYLKKDKLPNCRYFAVEHNNRIYHFFNAFYYPMGRMINKVATFIRGKNTPLYRNEQLNISNGNICVIVNIEDPLFTGKKLMFKQFRYHTGFVGHLKTYSYRHILNSKPELLYHFLLRRVMPKNKLSMKYIENLILCRGPTHDLTKFPQFAPDKRVYEQLPRTNIKQLLTNDPKTKLISEPVEGAAEKIFGRKLEPYQTEKDLLREERNKQQNIADTTKLFEDVPQTKTKTKLSEKKIQILRRRQKQIEDRYVPYRAPYKYIKRSPFYNKEKPAELFLDEKKARKHPSYEDLRNQDLEEVEDETDVVNPHQVGGGVFNEDDPFRQNQKK